MHEPLCESMIRRIESALLYLDDCGLECDGMTHAISFLLNDAGIAHQRMIGAAIDLYGGGTVFPHCWIVLSPGLVIDFRLRMWLGDHEHIPHGIFDSDLQGISYRGEPQVGNAIPLPVLSLMTDGKINEVTLKGVT